MSVPAEHHDLDGAPMPVLLEHMQGSHPRLRADAACALGDRLRTRELRRLDAQAHACLQRLLTDPVFEVRFEAAIALAEVHDQRATDVLLHATRPRTTRLDAIRALGTLGDARAVPRLRAIMHRWLMPWADRLQAAAALCAMACDAGADYLVRKLHSRKLAERAAAIHFVGESRHPRARPILEEILANRHDPLRDVAARTLGLLRDANACAALEAALADADDELAHDIREALANCR